MSANQHAAVREADLARRLPVDRATPSPRVPAWLWALLLGASLVVYFPALRAGFIWNDSDYVTSPSLRSIEGLQRVWFEVGATEQYYPVLHTAFWLEHKAWGDSPFGYHLINVLLHAGSAGLLIAILKLLHVRGAAFAGLLFALHPVGVESVAWIAEQKNTLSLILYLAAAHAYLRFDATRAKRRYVVASLLFAAALLSKSVTATLPAALLVVIWWRRGRLEWRQDWRPLLPWLAGGAAFGIFSAWVEHRFIGAQGGDFEFTFIERALLAGRVIWFYAAKFVWPADLVFIYPRWRLDVGELRQWWYPVGVIAALFSFWRWRARSRAPLAASLFFVGSLFPVLGFFNVYAFKFSFVADHWQYLPCMGLSVWVAATGARMLDALPSSCRWVERVIPVAMLGALAGMSFQQCGGYRDLETFYRTILRANPNAWIAYNNLGTHLVETGRFAEALPCFEAVLRLRPGHAETRANLGGALVRLGRLAEAAPLLEAAVRSDELRRRPSYADLQANWAAVLMHTNRLAEALPLLEAATRAKPEVRETRNLLGWTLGRLGRVAEALQEFDALLRQHPDFAEAYFGAGYWLAQQGRVPEAVARYQAGLRLAPQSPQAERDLAAVLLRHGQIAEAVAHFENVVRQQPNAAEAHNNLASALVQAGRIEEAIARFGVGLKLNPRDADARANLAIALVRAGRHDEAVAQCEEALRLDPGHAAARENLDRIRAARASRPRNE